MAILKRTLQSRIENWLGKNKIIILYGARQVGKTTLVKELLKPYHEVGLYLSCDRSDVRMLLEDGNVIRIRSVIGEKKFVVFDEAQHVGHIGTTLKLLHDEWPELQVIATGSSSFDLANRLKEPMTGRTVSFLLQPFSLEELTSWFPAVDLDAKLQFFMRYGCYPDIVSCSEEDAVELLMNLSESYLYRDVLMYENLKKPDLIVRLLQLLAMQVGNEVSLNELAVTLQVSRETVARYLDLLEKSFVIFRLTAFSRNLRKEITKKEKVYFVDVGIRNSLISRFNPIEFRDDIGALWENFLIVERRKMLNDHGIRRNAYFWRTHDGKEIDYLEEYEGQLVGYEFKWKKSRYAPPELFLNTYPNSVVHGITRENYRNFVFP